MKCEMDNQQVKVFGRAIHALARISEDLWLYPNEKGFGLRSMNSCRSAYGSVLFPVAFFQLYQWTTTSEMCGRNKSLNLKCKLGMKPVLSIFRCLNTLERNVEKCRIFTSFDTGHVIFQLFCKHGIIKTHNLYFQESEPLEAIFAKHMCPNVLKIQSRLLAEIMVHFPLSQEEITLAVTPLKVCFKSYFEDEIDFAKATYTEMHLDPEEFDYFQVGVDSEVTVCLKEFRGLVAFSEATAAPVSIYFDLSGKPNLIKSKLNIEGKMTHTEKEPIIVKAASKRPLCNKRQIATNELKSFSIPAVKRVDTHIAKTENYLSVMREMMPKTQVYNKFCSLFFGAVSPKHRDFNHPWLHLTTASDSEDDDSHSLFSKSSDV
ncbi:cell cycle checkpoint control protein RAD9B isoform X2 [Sminthopsis crassicaudata]|uniref:cell cycle checkpoint control protein RAD9B isoform X2 n=1 Tax=Sminthopsis crassicaudata TaxID=9301 RepID=UPI003D686B6F